MSEELKQPDLFAKENNIKIIFFIMATGFFIFLAVISIFYFYKKHFIKDFYSISSEILNIKALDVSLEKNFPFFHLASANESEKNLPLNANKPIEFNNLISNEEFELSGAGGIVIDAGSGVIFFEKNADEPLSIASITKLFTALVFIDNNPGWDNIYQIKAGDRRKGGKIYLFTGEKVKIKDLFYLSLIASDNTATAAIVNATGLTEEEFVALMNKKAAELNLVNTHFKDSIGLNDNNKSTAKEVAKIAKISFSNNDIRESVKLENYELNTSAGRKKIVYTTNKILENLPQEDISITGGKTGYTESAGYCFVGQFINNDKKEIISVILGENSDGLRFQQTIDLIKLVYSKL